NKSDDQDTENLTSQAVDVDDTPPTNVNKIDRSIPQTPTNQAVDVDDTPSTERQQSSTVSSTESQKYQFGDRVKFYPTFEHKSNDWKVEATIISIEYVRGYILTCTVKYKNRKREDRTAVICGGSADWLLRKL
ncbi:MAG: hypothetical protein ACKPGN_01150, partial [Dolichospermum sp.]